MANLKKSISKFKKLAIRAMSVIGAASFVAGFCVDSFQNVKTDAATTTSVAGISKLNNNQIDSNVEEYFDPEMVYQLPSTVSEEEDVSVIVSMNTDSVIDAYLKEDRKMSVGAYTETFEAATVQKKVERDSAALLRKLKRAGISYELGAKYDTILSGFEIVIKGRDYAKVGKLLDGDAVSILGETYEPAVTDVVQNDVDVQETGIFNSSNLPYQGDGVVVAVLDSGLDYTHTAFDPSHFDLSNKRFSIDDIDVTGMKSSQFTAGLTAQDVYVNDKIPYAYDYADKDPDVLPTNSDHGTHVSGIISGDDQQLLKGVAPNAQLVFMKVFSDNRTGAKDSWIMSALEDCVKLKVDVINMSLGSDCGFTTERSEVEKNEVYGRVKAAGISLIVSAANAYNSTMGSEKNGNLGLTSNPDSGTVGAPSTYDAALSVASVDGVKTPYLKYGEEIIYFNESTNARAETKHFVDELLATIGPDVNSYTFDYVTIGGLGDLSDYTQAANNYEYYKNKIVLVKRGVSTFEHKIRVALEAVGAAGIIIYNNVSGDISMSVGNITGAACSISQDDGEMLVRGRTGKLVVNKDYEAGPFMSKFSSWGPTSDLKLKPEITSHGGEIYSCIPGGRYERQSGTSMAAPNLAGATALIRQYVKYNENSLFGTTEELENDPVKVTRIVNQLMMSTADIVYNKHGLAYAVRKQGAGLINMEKATTSASYLTTYDLNGNPMDKTKFELGDDKDGEGVYTMTFDINNISSQSVSYDIGAIVMTEGVGETYTSHDELTVTEDGYLLDGASLQVVTVNGQAHSGTRVAVGAESSVKVTVKITLSEEDKKYLKDSFENGMYVEGFITLNAVSGTEVDVNAPFLAFFGDWTKAPILDEEYYDTHKDEINAGLDVADKLMADTVATRVYGGLYSEYIATMGGYYFMQDPSATQIAASKDRIVMSNNESDKNPSISSIYSLSLGVLRNIREVRTVITEDATGRVVYDESEYNIRKSRSSGSTFYGSSVEMDFAAMSRNLKNNTKYTVNVETYIDYGENKDQKNTRSTFTFPLYIDFEAPALTNVEYRTEYDKKTKKAKLYADLSIYDNHYAMGMQVGQITINPDYDENDRNEEDPMFSMGVFGKYMTPIYSSFNTTTKVTVELTDYIEDLKRASVGIIYDETGKPLPESNNSFIAICYDYAMNSATYEIRLPDEVMAAYFTETEVKLSPNETKTIDDTLLKILPDETWLQSLVFESSDESVATVIGQTIVAKASGTTTITVQGRDDLSLKVTVLDEDDDGYKDIDVSPVTKFSLTGYETIKAYYAINSEDREIGVTGGIYDFDKGKYVLSMFPSESVQLITALESAFKNDKIGGKNRIRLEYSSADTEIAKVDKNSGQIVALEEGETDIFVTVIFDDKPISSYTATVTVEVKDPYTTNSIYLMSYKGLGGKVTIPDDRGITTIYSYAFSNYEYVPKDLEAGDVIDKEDPFELKQSFLGETTIEEVIIPEGVTTIEAYAFAGLTGLKSVTLPTTLRRVGVGAFYGCTNLKTVNGIEYVQFISERGFYNCDLSNVAPAQMKDLVAIGNYAFENCKFGSLELSEKTQSIGIGAFYNNQQLQSLTFDASKVKIGARAFANCTSLASIEINAAVISARAFQGCKALSSVQLGRDVAVIGEYAFAGTNVSYFNVDYRNRALAVNDPTGTLDQGQGALLYKVTSETERELILCAPEYAGTNKEINLDTLDEADEMKTTKIGVGAFAGNTKLGKIVANSVTEIGAYAFTGCTILEEVSFDKVTYVSDYAFYNAAIKVLPNLSKVTSIGTYAFAGTDITEVNLVYTPAAGEDPVTITVGDYAFSNCTSLTDVVIGDNVTLGVGAFKCNIIWYDINGKDTLAQLNEKLQKYYTPYEYTVMTDDGERVYQYLRYDIFKTSGIRSNLVNVTLGDNVVVGDYTFDGNVKLKNVTLGENVSIGDYAFYNNFSLESEQIDLSTVVKIGDYAFSGEVKMDFYLNQSSRSLENAYVKEFIDGELVNVAYKSTYYAPSLKTVDLSSLRELGANAFSGNQILEGVVLGEGLEKISDYAFAYCPALTTLVLPSTVKEIGEYAFYGSVLASLGDDSLGNVTTIGKDAFTYTKLQSVKIAPNATIGDYAFYGCEDLATVENLDKAVKIGAYAFYKTAISSLDLANATYVGQYAFGYTNITSVSFNEKLTEIGDNPFVGCAIETYGKEVKKQFNGEDRYEMEYTYDINDTLKVIDGVLYQKIATGLELVSYPMANKATGYTVLEGTKRISASAFAGAPLQNVILASTLQSIGDKAFYQCESLNTVVFLSYKAPILEEEYDASHLTFYNLPFTGSMSNGYDVFEGLEIVPFYMWNIGGSTSNFYYGANFVDYVGVIKDKIVMVKPVNGLNYNTFIFSQYFDTVVEGNTAAMQVTLDAIALIDALPSYITLADEKAILEARAAYNLVTSKDQQALVTNYRKLTEAESTLEYYKSLEENDDPIVEPEPEPSSGCNGFVSMGALAGLAMIGAALFIGKRKNEQ